MQDESRDGAECLMELFPPITRVHCKCGKCRLHFKIYTWHPDRWKELNPICPECGEQGEWVVTGMAYEEKLTEIMSDADKWNMFLKWELDFSKEQGALDGATHMLVVIKKHV